jgi:hypothetical protein
MSATAYCKRQLMVARKVDCTNDVGGIGGARDQRGVPIEGSVAYLASRVVVVVGWPDELAEEVSFQVQEFRLSDAGRVWEQVLAHRDVCDSKFHPTLGR